MFNYCQLSNYLWCIPIYLLLKNNKRHMACCFATVMFFSIYYHSDETDENALYADMLGCVILTACLFYTFMSTETKFTFANLLSIVYGLVALSMFLRAGDPGSDCYVMYHTAWHLLSVYAVSIFVYSYFNTTVYEHAPTRLCKPLPVVAKDLGKPIQSRVVSPIRARLMNLAVNGRAIRRRLMDRVHSVSPQLLGSQEQRVHRVNTGTRGSDGIHGFNFAVLGSGAHGVL